MLVNTKGMLQNSFVPNYQDTNISQFVCLQDLNLVKMKLYYFATHNLFSVSCVVKYETIFFIQFMLIFLTFIKAQ